MTGFGGVILREQVYLNPALKNVPGNIGKCSLTIAAFILCIEQFLPTKWNKSPRDKSLLADGNANDAQYCWEITFSKLAMALPIKTEHAFEAEDFASDPKIVKFVVLKRHEEDRAKQENLSSFEAVMLPHLDAAHNLAKWLVRNEQDAQDVVQAAYLRAFRSFAGFRGSNGRAWLLTIVRNTSYTLLKKNRAVDLTTTFDEEIHGSGQESVSPAAILEHSENAALISEAMDELPAEFREILTLRHQEGLSYKEIADIAQIPPGTVMSRLARARAKLKEYLATHIGKEK